MKLIAESTANKPAWRRICIAHVIFYGAPVAGFHDDAMQGLITDGYCIGDFLASIFAFLGSVELSNEVDTLAASALNANADLCIYTYT